MHLSGKLEKRKFGIVIETKLQITQIMTNTKNHSGTCNNKVRTSYFILL